MNKKREARLKAEVKNRVEAFASELSRLYADAATEAVKDALAAARLPGSKGSRPSTTARQGTRRGALKKMAEDDLLREVRRKADRRIEELASDLGVSSKSLIAPMHRLVVQKKVRKKGVARGTRYRVA